MGSEPKSSWREAFRSCLPWARRRSSSDLTTVPLDPVAAGGSEPRPIDNTVQHPSSKPTMTMPLTDTATCRREPRPADNSGQHSESATVVPMNNQIADGGGEPRLTDSTMQRSSSEPTAPLTDIGTGSGELRPTDGAEQHSISNPTLPSTSIAGGGGKPGPKDNAVWGAMKLAMKGLRDALDVFPPLETAVGGLLECLTHLEASLLSRFVFSRIECQRTSRWPTRTAESTNNLPWTFQVLLANYRATSPSPSRHTYHIRSRM